MMGFLKKKEKPIENEEDLFQEEEKEEENSMVPIKKLPQRTQDSRVFANDIRRGLTEKKERKIVPFEQPAVQGFVWSDTGDMVAPDIPSLLSNIATRQEKIESKLDYIIGRMKDI